MPGIIDYLVIFLWIWLWFVALLIDTHKLYRFYIWTIFWFMLFMILNYKINIIELTLNLDSLTWWNNFLFKNKDFVLSFSISMIPIFWIFSFIMSNKVENNKIYWAFLWFILPFFILWVFTFILSRSILKLEFLDDIFSNFSNTFLFNIFSKNLFLIFYLIIFVLFLRFFLVLSSKFFSDLFEKLKELKNKWK